MEAHRQTPGKARKTVAGSLVVACVMVLSVPPKAHSGIIEGALIGGAIGAVVGLLIEASKPKPTDTVPKPRAQVADSLSRRDSIPIFQ